MTKRKELSLDAVLNDERYIGGITDDRTPEQLLSYKEMNEKLESGIKKLTLKEREFLKYRLVDGMGVYEIAEETGLKVMYLVGLQEGILKKLKLYFAAERYERKENNEGKVIPFYPMARIKRKKNKIDWEKDVEKRITLREVEKRYLFDKMKREKKKEK